MDERGVCLVSIIIPVHNTVSYLKRCVESVRNQSLENIEIILVDNLSTDGSSELCDEYAQIDSRIKVLHLSQSGPSIARNAGIEVASAPFIGFVDSDDHIAPTMYCELYDALSASKAGVAYCNFCYEYEDTHCEHPYQNSGNTFLRSTDDVLREIMLGVVSSSACTKLFRRELFDSLRFPEGVFFEDHLITHQWIAMCHQVVWVDKMFYFYYQRATSTCHNIDPIKRYHYFLADYARLAFIKERSLFSGEGLFEANSLIVRNCLMHFREVLLMVELQYFHEPINEMRIKIKELASFSKQEIQGKLYSRIRKISYFWFVYYFFHFSFKRKVWRP